LFIIFLHIDIENQTNEVNILYLPYVLLHFISFTKRSEVCLAEELHKEHSVRDVHQQAEQCHGINALLAALATHPDVRRGHEPDDHLGDLRHGDCGRHPSGQPDLGDHECVVQVHDTMNAHVHRAVYTRHGKTLGVHPRGVQQNGHMVVQVQKDNAAFAEHEKNGVSQFEHLANCEEKCVEICSSIAKHGHAESVVDALGKRVSNYWGHAKS